MKNNVEKIYGLSPMQEGMLFHKLLEPKSTEYVLQYSVDYEGDLNLVNVEKAVHLLSVKHEILRTAFAGSESGDKPFQLILKNRHPEVQIIDCSQTELDSIETIKQNNLERGFDLKNDSLMRVIIIKTADKKYSLIWSAHHIIVDGWSLSILFEDFMKFYKMLENLGLTQEDIIELISKEQVGVPTYQDYIRWRKKENWEQHIQYWNNLLEGYESVASIPQLYRKETISTKNYYDFVIDNDLYKRLKELSKHLHVTINSVIEVAWGLLLQYYMGNEDVVFGKVVSGRNVPIDKIEKTVGLFINTVPVRVNSNNKTLRTLLTETHEQGMSSDGYGDFSLLDIQKNLGMHHSAFDTLIVFENYYISKQSQTDFSSLKNFILNKDGHEKTNYPITLLIQCDSQLSLKLLYDGKYYTFEDAKRILSIMNNILGNFESSLDMLCRELNCLSEEEFHQVSIEYNGKSKEYSLNKTVVDYWEESVSRHSEKIAIRYNGNNITYNQLNSYANQIAMELRKIGVKPNEFVAIIADRSIEMICGIYGVIKSGAAYIPIDPNCPKERIDYILGDSNAKVVLKATSNHYELTNIVTIDLQRYKWKDNCKNIMKLNKSSDIMYCIYTSGTTGNPKGVLCTHAGLVNRIMWMQDAYPLMSNDIILQKTNYTFDPSVWEFVWWALHGCCVAILNPDEEKNPEAICQAISKYNISILHFVPSMLEVFLEHLNCDSLQKKELHSLRIVFCSGEALSVDTVKNFYNLFKTTKLVNLYGPTEASIDITSYDCLGDEKIIPIGKPINNMNIYILQHNRLCGIGAPGELCVSGIGVAKGYLNNLKMTEEKFVKNLFGYGKMYRTGDIARWLPDGNIEFLGRMDDQIKIRGMRIELGEIEATIRSCKNIISSVVISKKDSLGYNTLYAYFTSKEDVDLKNLRKELSQRLPEHMVPKYFMRLDEIPRLQNGKINRRALPNIQFQKKNVHIGARDENDVKILAALSNILGIDNISLDDQLYELGLDSIKAIRLTNALRESGYIMSIKELLTAETVYDVIEILNNKSNYEMSPLQKELMLYNTLIKKEIFVLKSKNKLDNKKLLESINKIIMQSNMLHASFMNSRIHIETAKTYDNIQETQCESLNNNMNALYILNLEHCDSIELWWNEYENFIVDFFEKSEPKEVSVIVLRCSGFDYILFYVNPLFFDLKSEEILLNEFRDEYNGSSLICDNKTNIKLWNDFLRKYDINKFDMIPIKNEIINSLLSKNTSYYNVDFTLSEKETKNLRFKLGAILGFDLLDAITCSGLRVLKHLYKKENAEAVVYNDLRKKDLKGTLNGLIGRMDSCSIMYIENDFNIHSGAIDMLRSVKEKGIRDIGYDIYLSIHVDESEHNQYDYLEKMTLPGKLPVAISLIKTPFVIASKIEDARLNIAIYGDDSLYNLSELNIAANLIKTTLKEISQLCEKEVVKELFSLSNMDKDYILDLGKRYLCNAENADVKKEYYPTKKQKEYFLGGEIMFGRVSVQKKVSINVMKNALLDVIKEQSALRSLLKSKKCEKILELACNEKWFVPIIDVSEKPQIEEELFSDSQWINEYKKFFISQNMLCSILVFRVKSDEYKIWIAANHCIWDMKSFEIFERRLNLYLNGEKINEVCSYAEAIEQIEKTGYKEIQQYFSDFLEKSKEYLLALDKKERVCHITKKIPIEKVLQKYTNFNELAIALMRSNIKTWLPNDSCLTHIPVLMLYHNRNDANKDITGLFVDQIPITIPINESTECNIDTQISSVIDKWGIMPNIENRIFDKLFSKYRMLPLINIAASYQYDDGGESTVVQAWNNSLKKVDYKFSQSVYLHINVDNVIVTIITFEKNKEMVDSELKSLLL